MPSPEDTVTPSEDEQKAQMPKDGVEDNGGEEVATDQLPEHK